MIERVMTGLKESITEVGLDEFKKTSVFMSNAPMTDFEEEVLDQVREMFETDEPTEEQIDEFWAIVLEG